MRVHVRGRGERELAAPANGEACRAVVVDPEALVLGSLVTASHERRLEVRLRWWTDVGLGLTGVQRFRSLMRNASARVRADAAAFEAHLRRLATVAAADAGAA